VVLSTGHVGDALFGFHPWGEVGLGAVAGEVLAEEDLAVAGAVSVAEGRAADGRAAVRTHDFLRQLDEAAVIQAIQQAESRTSGEIRVFITARHVDADAIIDRAASRFEKLGMSTTQDRNAVLLYFAPRSQQFAIIGDKGVHQKFGADHWEEIASTMASKLRAGRFTEAVVSGIEMAGDLLARHFPRRTDDRNELPDEIDRE
jgi:uncharacterized membrane protein